MVCSTPSVRTYDDGALRPSESVVRPPSVKRPMTREERGEVAAFVRSLRTRLNGLTAGSRQARATVAQWARDVATPKRLHADAHAVVESLCAADEMEDDVLVLGEDDFAGYLRLLSEGEAFHGDDDPLVLLRLALSSLDAQSASKPVRFWEVGLGWYLERRFCSPATGRPFVAMADVEGSMMTVRKRREDDGPEALEDLLETLRVERSSIEYVQEGLSLDAELFAQSD